jgi:hypothetical protein
MKHFLIIIFIFTYFNILGQEYPVFKGELEVDAFTRSFIVSGGVTLLTHEVLPKKMKPFWKKTISILSGIVVNESINYSTKMNRNVFIPVGETSGSITVILLIPKKRKRIFRYGNLWQ